MKEKQRLDIKIGTWIPVLVLVMAWWLPSCTEPEPFSNTPRIKFKDLQFKKNEVNGSQDSLIIFFDFEDGDGNLGLDDRDSGYPYHDFEIIVDSLLAFTENGQRYATFKFVTFGETNVYPPFFKYNPFSNFVDVTDTFSLTDNRPAFNCEYYDTLRINPAKDNFILPGSINNIEGYSTDTVYLTKNPLRNNMFVNFYIDFQGNGNFELYNWEYATNQYGCGDNFNGRFPIWDFDNLKNGTSLQGTIKYSMRSLGFEQILRTREFKLEFYIVDRKFNYSDTVLTKAFTLQSLLFNQSQE